MRNAVDAYPIMWTWGLDDCPQCGQAHKSRIVRLEGTESDDGNTCRVEVECPEGDYRATLNAADRPDDTEEESGDAR